MKIITPEEFLNMDEDSKEQCRFNESGDLEYDKTYFGCYERSSGDVVKHLEKYIKKHGMSKLLLRVIQIKFPSIELG